VDAAFGMLGLETALGVVWTVLGDRLGWDGVARVMSANPARIAGLAEHGHAIEVGCPATFTLVDPAATWVVDRDASLSLSRNNPWHDRKLTGQVRATYLRGREAFAR
jgi:dihydroorotase